MTSRRDFLRTSGLVTLGLLVGPDAIAAWERLQPRRLWTGADFGRWPSMRFTRLPCVWDGELLRVYNLEKEITDPMWKRIP